MQAAASNRMAKVFARVDKDNDGVLLAEEFAKLRHMVRKSVGLALSLKLIKTQGISGQLPRLLPAARELPIPFCKLNISLDALTDASDDALLVLFANGDQSAATALTQRLTSRVLAHAYRLLGK